MDEVHFFSKRGGPGTPGLGQGDTRRYHGVGECKPGRAKSVVMASAKSADAAQSCVDSTIAIAGCEADALYGVFRGKWAGKPIIPQKTQRSGKGAIASS